MSEETKVVDPGAGTTIPGEAESTSASPREQQEIAVKDKAKSLGWKPLKEYEGDPSDWVTAKEFLGRQSFFDKIKAQSSEIRSLRDDIKLMNQHFGQMKEIEYKKALADLKAERKEAVSQGDTSKVELVSEQITEIESARKDTKQQVKTYGQEEFNDFKQRNSWYNSDADLTKQANILGMGYSQLNPNATPAEVLNYVEGEIKKVTKTQKTISPVSPEAGGIKQTRDARSGKLKESDLNEMQLKMMKTFVARGVLTKEQYLDQLSDKEGNR